MKDNLFVAVVVAIGLVVVAVGYVTLTHKAPLGAVTGPDSYFPCETHNGVITCNAYQRFNRTATTTVCSFKSPAATSTLTFGSLKLSTGSSTDMLYEFGQDATFAATTTSLGKVLVTSATLNTTLASTTPVAGSASAMIFGPNRFFNVKWGGAFASANVIDGSCAATFVLN